MKTKAISDPALAECARLARKICRRKYAARQFLGTEYTQGHREFFDGQPCARFRSLIRGNEWVTPLESLRRI